MAEVFKRKKINNQFLWVARGEVGFWVKKAKNDGPFFVTLLGESFGDCFKTPTSCTCQSSAQKGQECLHIQAAKKFVKS